MINTSAAEQGEARRSTSSSISAPPAVPWGVVLGTVLLGLLTWGVTAWSWVETRLPPATFLSHALPLLLSTFVVAVYLGVAVLIGRARTLDPAPRYLLGLLPLLGVGHSQDVLLLTAVPGGTVGGLDVFLRQGLPALEPGAILAFLTVFPSRQRLPRWLTPGLLLVFSALPFAWAVVDFQRLGPVGFCQPSVRLFLCNLLVIGANLAAIVRLVLGALRAETEADRQRARIVFFPTTAWVILLILVNNLSYYLESRSAVPHALTAILSVIFPLSLAIAIRRTRLFEIDRFLRLGMAHVAISALMATIFLVAAPALASRVAVSFPQSEGLRELSAGLLAVLLVLAMNPLRERLQRALDASFYKTRQDPYNLLLTALAPGSASTGEPLRAGEVSALVDRVLHPEKQWLWLDDGQARTEGKEGPEATQPLYAPKRAEESSEEAVPLSTPRTIQAFLLDQPLDSMFKRSGEEETESSAIRDLFDSGYELVLPLRGSMLTVLGFWALGPKKSEEPYSTRELEALRALARAMAVHAERDQLAAQVEFERLARQRRQAEAAGEGEAFAECPRCGLCYDSEGSCREDGAATVSVQVGSRTLATRYRLDQRIGRGGMGAVYRAYDLTLRRDVAVKLIRQDQAQHDVSRQRFRQEALLAARLSHPNAVAVLDTGEFPGGLYHVMELVEGGNLAVELRNRGRIPFEEAWPFIEGMLAALSAAHDVGLVHRDVKPSNLLLSRGRSGDVTVKLADFGLARAMESDAGLSAGADLTRTGTIVGSPGYMSPEVMAGRPATPSSDVWSAAVTSYELLTGTRPFLGASLVEIYEVAKAEVFTPLLSSAPAVPPRFAAVLESALSSSPKRRPKTAGRFLETLRASL